jgi:hypothetical protein
MVMQQRVSSTANGATEIVVQRAVELAFDRLRLDRSATADQVEEIVHLVDSGALDTAIERNAPPGGRAAAPRRYADVKPFSYDAWKLRHDVKD